MYELFSKIRNIISPKIQTNYVSEITKFINELKQQDPNLEAKQLYGRNLLWNKPQELDINNEFNQGQIKQSSYVYYSLPDTTKPVYNVEIDKVWK